MIAFIELEVRRTFRNAKFLLFLVALPCLLYLGTTSTGDSAASTAQFAMPYSVLALITMGTYATMGAAMYATGPELANERASGWIRQLMVTPLTNAAWVGAKLGQGCLIALPSVVAVAVTAVVAHHVDVPPARLALLCLVALVGALPFGIVGQIIGLRCAAQTASAVQFFVLIGMAFLGGVFLPFSTLPAVAQTVGRLTPAYDLVQISSSVALGQAPGLAVVAGLVAWTAGLAALVLWLWRRDDAAG